MKLRILFAIPALDHGGPDRVLFEVLSRLDRSRFEPHLLVSERGGYYYARLPPDVTVTVLEGGGRYPVVPAVRAIHQLAPDIVLATQRMILTLGVLAKALPRRTRLIVRQANDVSADTTELLRTAPVKQRVVRAIARAVLRSADIVICQSDAMARDVAAQIGASDHLRVIHNPIDVERVRRLVAEGATVRRGAPALVSVGRLARQKGFDLVLPALAQVRRRFPDVHLTILGDGPERAALELQARALGLGDAVTFAGFSDEPLSAVGAADLFVLASRYEGFPNAALEAIACGTPIVLTDCPGANRDIVVPGRNGQLAATLDPASIAGSIEHALVSLDSVDRAWISADTQARFGAATIVAAYERVFVEVAQSGGRRS